MGEWINLENILIKSVLTFSGSHTEMECAPNMILSITGFGVYSFLDVFQ